MIDFEMTDEQLQKIIAASKPTPVMFLTGGKPMFKSAQENSNEAWKELGEELGFDYMTVEPNGKGDKHFSANKIEGK